MDLKEYFRDVDAAPAHVQRRVRRDSAMWQWRMLRTYPKPTLAMVNGWCFGGAFTPLVACDLALAADEATFGLSEVNWGIPPGGVVSRALAETVGTRAALLHIMLLAAALGVQELRLLELGVEVVLGLVPAHVTAVREAGRPGSCRAAPAPARVPQPLAGHARVHQPHLGRAAAVEGSRGSWTRSGSGPDSSPTSVGIVG
jgi:enoyl-CoA hydratase/carnithine racemase